MKRVVALAVLAGILLTGCEGDFLPYARDIETMELIRTLALDAGAEQDQVTVTVSGGVQRTGSEGQGEKPALFTKDAKTVYDACNAIQAHSSKYVFFGHVTEWVLGEEIARQGLMDLTDFMERDAQIRLNTKAFVVKGGKAEDVLRETASKSSAATERLQSIEVDYQLKSVAYSYTVQDIIGQMQENGCGLIPAIELKQNVEEEQSTEVEKTGESSSGGSEEAQGQEEQTQNETEIRSVGYGYFKDNRLMGFLNEYQARGVNLLLNQAESGTVEVELPNGSVAALRLVKSRCKWDIEVKEDVVTGITAQLEVEANLAELRGEADLADQELIRQLRQGLSETIQKEVEQVLVMSRREQADFLHLRRIAAVREPWLNESTQEHWEEWFPQMELKAEVKGVVRRSYDIGEPIKMVDAEVEG